MAADKRTVYIFGDRDGEHLRAEITGGEVVLISYECIPGRTQNQWRDRNIVAMPLEKWIAVGAVAGGEDRGGKDGTQESTRE